MEPAGVDIWTGMDAALPDDGDGGLVGLEKVRLGKSAAFLWDSARSECSLDTDLFWGTTTGLGVGGYHGDVGCDPVHDDGIFS